MRFYDAAHLLETRDSTDEMRGKLPTNLIEEAMAELLKSTKITYTLPLLL